MELLIFDQESQLKCQETQLTEIEDEVNLKKKEVIKKKDEVECLNKKKLLLSQQINNKKRKQAHKNNIFHNIICETSSYVAKINLQKRKKCV